MMNNVIVVNGDYFGFDVEQTSFPLEVQFSRMGESNSPNRDFVSGIPNIINFKNNKAFKVFMCSNEPSSSINREHNSVIVKNYFNYDLILTTEEEVLNSTPNSILFPYGGTWLNKKSGAHNDSLGVFDETSIENLDKKFAVSFLTTSHLGKSGYNLRQKIWINKDIIKIPSVFYSSTRYPTDTLSCLGGGVFSTTKHNGFLPNDDKFNLFDCQFSIAVESSRENSYFTEKLIDCLLTKTVPVYWGCPNIEDFFDKRGILHFKNYEEYVQIVNSIDETTYENMKPYVEANYKKAKEYGRCLLKRICELSEKVYNERISKKDILLTIGILTVPEREPLLTRLLQRLSESMLLSFNHRVEIMINSDNKIKTVGQKRNEILDSAKGKYVCFIDDDDMVTYDYLSKILYALDTEKYDAVSFSGQYYHSGNSIMQFNHANINGGHFKKDGVQFRPLNHLNPVLTEYARQIRFPEKNYAEDSDYCDRLYASKLIKNEYGINSVIYLYLFDPSVTLTQKN